MSIKPIGERILAKNLKHAEKTASGIILAASSLEKNENIMKIVAIGNGDNVSKEFKLGDKIICSSYSGTKVKYDNEEYLIIDFEHILGIIE